MAPTADENKRRDWLTTGVAGIGVAVTLVADLTGVAQLFSQPFYVILVIGALALICLSIPLLAAHRGKPRPASFWIAITAVASACLVVLGTIAYPAVVPSNKPATPTVQSSQGAHDGAPRSAPSTINTVTAVQLNIGRGQGQGRGIDLDTPGARPVDTEVATDQIDFAVHFYGSVQASQEGFYALPASINTRNAYTECTKEIANQKPQKEISPTEGAQYCLHTSDNNIAWVVISASKIVSFDTDRYVTISAQVWRQ